MKQRFSSLDVRVIAHELSHSLVTLRLANVYDLSSRVFLLKFAKPDHREQVLIDSGFRCHLTSFSRATATTPSPFVARLRKFLRTRRVTAVEQIGTDRVLEIRFSDGAYRLFLEFYAGGNIVLTDSELTILALLRSVNEGAEHEQYRAGLKYDLSLRQNYGGVPALTKDRLRDGLHKAIEKQREEALKPGKKIKKKVGDALRKALAVTTTEFPPILIDHALHVAKVDRLLTPEEVLASDELLDQVLLALDEAAKVIAHTTSQSIAKCYIIAKPSQKSSQSDSDEASKENQNLIYDDFHAFKPAQLMEDPSIVFLESDGFNTAVDRFFSSIEGQKLESRLQEREHQARQKIENARSEQSKRLDGLQQVQETNVRKAQAIEANVERVEEAVAAVNGLIAQGMDWVDIGRLIEIEQSKRNPVAELIKLPLKLEENTITLLLSELDTVEEDDLVDDTDSENSDSEDEGAAQASAKTKQEDKRLAIDIDLAASAWSNARQYYDQKRTAAVKQEKTAQASEKALRSTEQKVMADLKKGLKQEKDILRPVRKQFWFEKFIYFVSSDGYLVLAGRDIQQSEILYYRHLKKGDVYIHADLAGAASVIVKNHPATPNAPIPPSTLSQAGSLAVCTSSAWESKAVMSAWWVNAEQVSKTTPTKDVLAPGEFIVRGEKNFLPPAQLLLGFAVMFQISDESKARHVKHRLLQAPSETATPDLTDDKGSVAESDDEDIRNDGSDDDFPDASTGHVAAAEPSQASHAQNAGLDDDDDDFPDVNRTNGDDDDANTDGEERFRQANPLQSRGAHVSVSDLEDEDGGDEDDDEQEEEHDDDEPENEETENRPDESAGHGREHEQGPTTVASDDAGDSSADQESGAQKAYDSASGVPGSQLSNKERKAQNRVEHGKPAEKGAAPSKQHLKGKKGKARKAAAKYARYAHQDEEDREIAMRLLGSRTAKERSETESKPEVKAVESAQDARARRKAQHDKAQRQGLEAEEARRLAFEKNDHADDDEDVEALVQLEALIGTPLQGDEILEAIPVCAPWNALSKYKYKVKLQPGQQKKGKALREILGKWAKDSSDSKKLDSKSEDTERIWPREAELIKGWKEPEVVGVIPVKMVRVMMSGGSAQGSKGGRGGKAGRGGKGSKKSR